MKIVGTNVNRRDGWEKVSGQAKFIDDITIPGIWHGGTVRSYEARGTINGIRFDPAFDWSSVVVVTPHDIPGKNAVSMIHDDMPALAENEVRYLNEPLVLIAAPDKAKLARALNSVQIDIDRMDPIIGIEEALSADNPVFGTDNILAEHCIEHGDVNAGFAEADLIIEGLYETGHQEHLYLEPNGMIASPRDDGGVEITGSLQCPYYIMTALEKCLALSSNRLVVRQAATGGAFGGKEDFPSVLALHAALLAFKSGRPVKMIYGRSEDILCTTKRHPSLISHRTGVTKDGRITAAEIDLILDGGAYTTLSPVVLSRAVLHATGAYRVPNARIRGKVVATNTPPNGAFRGFGAPQALFAIERQMDKIAAATGHDPLEVRRLNLLRHSDTLPCGQILDHPGAEVVLERAVELSGYENKWQDPGGKENKKRGVGISLFLHGGGFTGGGEEWIKGIATVKVSTEGLVDILVSNVEMGQGSSTVLGMIAAETLGVPLDHVRFQTPDTSLVPDSGPTVASRTTMIVGSLVAEACRELLNHTMSEYAKLKGVNPGEIKWDDGVITINGRKLSDVAGAIATLARNSVYPGGSAQYHSPENFSWDEEHYRGDAYKSYSWGANVVEAEVNSDTFEVTPLKVTAVVEIGKAINPQMVEGQVEGATLQSLGYGYMEEIKSDGGRFLNDRMATCLIPTTADTPKIDVIIEEIPHERGPFGAKGLGELPIHGAAPALAAAIENAIGISASELPMTPEKLLKLSERINGGGCK